MGNTNVRIGAIWAQAIPTSRVPVANSWSTWPSRKVGDKQTNEHKERDLIVSQQRFFNQWVLDTFIGVVR